MKSKINEYIKNNIMKMSKKLVYLMSFVSLVLLSSCGGEDNGDALPARTLPQGMIEYDLTKHGLPLVAVIPDTVDQPVVVDVKDWGETTIAVGKYFQIQIAEGGDMALRKQDLAEDLLYKATYTLEEEKAIVYKQEIPDGGLKPQYHFYYIVNIDGIDYEIQDVISGDVFYTPKAVDIMLEASKLIIAAPKLS